MPASPVAAAPAHPSNALSAGSFRSLQEPPEHKRTSGFTWFLLCVLIACGTLGAIHALQVKKSAESLPPPDALATPKPPDFALSAPVPVAKPSPSPDEKPAEVTSERPAPAAESPAPVPKSTPVEAAPRRDRCTKPDNLLGELCRTTCSNTPKRRLAKLAPPRTTARTRISGLGGSRKKTTRKSQRRNLKTLVFRQP